MLVPTSDIGSPAALAAGVILLAVFTSVLLARAAHRAQRDGSRRQAGELFGALGRRLAGRMSGKALREAVRDAESEHFWDATEAITTNLRHSERLELARALEHNRHAAAERRVLREETAELRRELAARRLGLLPSKRARAALRRALVAGPESVRFAAARSLARHRDLRALRWLLDHPGSLSARPLPALTGLLRAFGPGARAMLISALDRGFDDSRFECACLDLLGLTRCRSARGQIEARLRRPDVELRVAAARALGRLGMAESIPSLILSLTDDGWPVRAMAAQALGRLSAAPAVEALVPLVSDRAWWVRHHAAYALAALGADGHDALCTLVARASDPYAREMAREALDHGLRRRA